MIPLSDNVMTGDIRGQKPGYKFKYSISQILQTLVEKYLYSVSQSIYI